MLKKNINVFIWGNFNVLHPGHLRLIKFASDCGGNLLIGITPNGTKGVYVDENIRLEAFNSLRVLSNAFIMYESIEEVINRIKPEIIIKGKEYENIYNIESELIEKYGGKLIFTSGEVQFSSLGIFKNKLKDIDKLIEEPREYLDRHQIKKDNLITILNKYKQKKILIIGDVIVDEYIDCEALGMSQEDPTVVVSPLQSKNFIGGSGIVAAHAASLCGQSTLITVIGNDKESRFVKQILKKNKVKLIDFKDNTRPTTLKQRFRVSNKTLLRVSKLRQHSISRELINEIFIKIKELIIQNDLVIFSDFNYGCLPQELVDKITSECINLKIPFTADSQSSSQIGDISRFKNALLLTPTEREARLALRDNENGIANLVKKLSNYSIANNILLTLGQQGVFLYSPINNLNQYENDQIPALNPAPKDVSGAGDSMLLCSSLALICDGSIWEAAYLGSIAAAIQVSKIGNIPLRIDEIMKEIQ